VAVIWNINLVKGTKLLLVRDLKSVF